MSLIDPITKPISGMVGGTVKGTGIGGAAGGGIGALGGAAVFFLPAVLMGVVGIFGGAVAGGILIGTGVLGTIGGVIVGAPIGGFLAWAATELFGAALGGSLGAIGGGITGAGVGGFLGAVKGVFKGIAGFVKTVAGAIMGHKNGDSEEVKRLAATDAEMQKAYLQRRQEIATAQAGVGNLDAADDNAARVAARMAEQGKSNSLAG